MRSSGRASGSLLINPLFPIFIPSKGRADRPLTARRLTEMKVPFRIVVEPSEAEAYRAVVGTSKLLILPFENLGQGSIPARNWIWERAIEEKADWHWVIDDNVHRFFRLTLNRRIPVTSGTIFRCIEDFVLRYENIALAGLNNIGCAPDREPNRPPFLLNTRIYSMTLIRTALPYRWRGRYNEDTDLSLRVLKDGWCTVQFNAFLGDKRGTMTMRGGNTDTIYNTGDHRLAFAQSLQEQHPDVVEVVWKFGRWHHQVDYSPFRKNKLRLRAGVTPTGGQNEYGMVLRRRDTTADQEPLFAEPVTIDEPLVLPVWNGTEAQGSLF